MAHRSGSGEGGGAVDTVNGIAPVGGDVPLTAADIPSDGPSDVQADIDALEAALAAGETIVDTAISATTATLGPADAYRATGAGVTITISSADIVQGAGFKFMASSLAPLVIATEGGETINGGATATLIANFATLNLLAVGGNLENA